MGGGGGYGGNYMAGAGGPMRNGKQPDWQCPEPNCQNRNFGWREVCNRCQVHFQVVLMLNHWIVAVRAWAVLFPCPLGDYGSHFQVVSMPNHWIVAERAVSSLCF